MGDHRDGIEAPKSILVLKPSSFGDIVHTLPAVARLKDAWPICRVSWVVNQEWAPLLADNPDVDEVVLFPRQDFRGLVGWHRFARWCRETITARRPDVTLDFQGLLRTAFIGRASRPEIFWGMSDAREGAYLLYDRVAQSPTGPVHAVDRYLLLVKQVLGAAFQRGPMRFPLPPGESTAEMTDVAQGGFILLHPYARGGGKSLTEPQIEAILQRLASYRVVVVGRSEDRRPRLSSSVVDLVNKTSLLQLIRVIRQAACVVTVDSGPAHLAAALGKPQVAIHTWSDPRRVGPYREEAWVWKNARLMQMKDLRLQDEAFFRRSALPLGASDIDAVCDLAISLSGSCA